MKLSQLSPKKGSRKVSRRVGRGESSGSGKTSGHGGKGQTARSGGTINPGFEGGQMPLYRRLPKWGFTSRQKVLGMNRYQSINLSVLEKFENGATIDPEMLRKAGYGRTASKGAGYKILGTGELTKKLKIKAHAVSESARAKIEKAGGTIELLKNEPAAK